MSIRSLLVGTCSYLCLLCMPHIASGAEGAVEINQARAVAGGVTPGDSPGFPVTITEPGHYILTGNLTVSVNSSAIVMEADNIDLDLRGFFVTTSTSSGNKDLIAAWDYNGNYHHGISISNGTLKSAHRNGISLGDRGRVVNLHVLDSDRTGIYAQNQCTVVESRLIGNGIHGMDLGQNCRAKGNIVASNATFGILVEEDSVVTSNTVRGNLQGISSGSGTVIKSNAVNGNTNAGILGGGLIIGNTVRNNGGYGLYLIDSLVAVSGYKDNLIENNGIGAVGGSGGQEIGTNICNGNLTCP